MDDFKVIRNAIPADEIKILNEYAIQITKHKKNVSFSKDPDFLNTPSFYLDPMMTLYQKKHVWKLIEKEMGIKILPTYNYWRAYKPGDILKKHKDRDACEVSATINIGGNKEWPIFIKDTSGKEHKIILYPGDMLVYNGCECEHWREQFDGKYCNQVFYHFVDVSSRRVISAFDNGKNVAEFR